MTLALHFFTKLQYKKINSLLKKNIFEIISISDIFNRIKIFNFYFIDKIKNKKTAMGFKKLKKIIQTYNNYNKEEIVT